VTEKPDSTHVWSSTDSSILLPTRAPYFILPIEHTHTHTCTKVDVGELAAKLDFTPLYADALTGYAVLSRHTSTYLGNISAIAEH
jgi:hypothetical protein